MLPIPLAILAINFVIIPTFFRHMGYDSLNSLILGCSLALWFWVSVLQVLTGAWKAKSQIILGILFFGLTWTYLIHN